MKVYATIGEDTYVKVMDNVWYASGAEVTTEQLLVKMRQAGYDLQSIKVTFEADEWDGEELSAFKCLMA